MTGLAQHIEYDLSQSHHHIFSVIFWDNCLFLVDDVDEDLNPTQQAAAPSRFGGHLVGAAAWWVETQNCIEQGNGGSAYI